MNNLNPPSTYVEMVFLYLRILCNIDARATNAQDFIFKCQNCRDNLN